MTTPIPPNANPYPYKDIVAIAVTEEKARKRALAESTDKLAASAKFQRVDESNPAVQVSAEVQEIQQTQTPEAAKALKYGEDVFLKIRTSFYNSMKYIVECNAFSRIEGKTFRYLHSSKMEILGCSIANILDRFLRGSKPLWQANKNEAANLHDCARILVSYNKDREFYPLEKTKVFNLIGVPTNPQDFPFNFIFRAWRQFDYETNCVIPDKILSFHCHMMVTDPSLYTNPTNNKQYFFTKVVQYCPYNQKFSIQIGNKADPLKDSYFIHNITLAQLPLLSAIIHQKPLHNLDCIPQGALHLLLAPVLLITNNPIPMRVSLLEKVLLSGLLKETADFNDFKTPLTKNVDLLSDVIIGIYISEYHSQRDSSLNDAVALKKAFDDFVLRIKGLHYLGLRRDCLSLFKVHKQLLLDGNKIYKSDPKLADPLNLNILFNNLRAEHVTVYELSYETFTRSLMKASEKMPEYAELIPPMNRREIFDSLKADVQTILPEFYLPIEAAFKVLRAHLHDLMTSKNILEGIINFNDCNRSLQTLNQMLSPDQINLLQDIYKHYLITAEIDPVKPFEFDGYKVEIDSDFYPIAILAKLLMFHYRVPTYQEVMSEKFFEAIQNACFEKDLPFFNEPNVKYTAENIIQLINATYLKVKVTHQGEVTSYKQRFSYFIQNLNEYKDPENFFRQYKNFVGMIRVSQNLPLLEQLFGEELRSENISGPTQHFIRSTFRQINIKQDARPLQITNDQIFTITKNLQTIAGNNPAYQQQVLEVCKAYPIVLRMMNEKLLQDHAANDAKAQHDDLLDIVNDLDFPEELPKIEVMDVTDSTPTLLQSIRYTEASPEILHPPATTTTHFAKLPIKIDPNAEKKLVEDLKKKKESTKQKRIYTPRNKKVSEPNTAVAPTSTTLTSLIGSPIRPVSIAELEAQIALSKSIAKTQTLAPKVPQRVVAKALQSSIPKPQLSLEPKASSRKTLNSTKGTDNTEKTADEKGELLELGAIRGFPQIGNNCYALAPLQMLLNSSHFHWITQRFPTHPDPNMKALHASWQKVYEEHDKKNYSGLKKSLIAMRDQLFSGMHFELNKEANLKLQHDAEYFVSLLLDACGYKVEISETRFSESEKGKPGNQPMQLIALPFDLTPEEIKEKKPIQLTRMIDQYMLEHVDDEKNAWEPNGKPIKRYDIVRKITVKPAAPDNETRNSKADIPEMLVFQIKRYNYSVENNKSFKVENPVDFPKDLILDMTKHFADGVLQPNEKALYKIQSCTTHKGVTLSGGHYVAFVQDGNSWYDVSDNHRIKAVNVSDPGIKDAYLILAVKYS